MSPISRRQFLHAVSAATLGQTLHRTVPHSRRQQADGRPNIILVLFDTLSARHMSLYGYGRATTPHIDRLAANARVYHRHYAGGNYTTPGAATLLTGTLPWTHRAFNPDGQILPDIARRNLFNALPADYHRLAFSQNPVADVFLDQFAADIDHRVRRPPFHAADPTWLIPRLPNDRYLAYNTELRLGREEGSLLLGLLERLRLERHARQAQDGHNGRYGRHDLYPLGLPHNLLQTYFTVEATVDGIADLAAAAPQPFCAYFHLWPPHDPYRPARPFFDRFTGDAFAPPDKPLHPLATGQSPAAIAADRTRYDEFIAHIDAEFGRLHARLDAAGLLDNSVLILTSDHGELFERGIQGHFTLALYEGLTHIPLLIWPPSATERSDIHTPTSAADLLGTIAALAGSDTAIAPRLPQADGATHPIFSVEAKLNGKWAPLTDYTAALVHGDDKLILYQYEGQTRVELYDLAADPEELVDLAPTRTRRAADLHALLAAEIARHPVP